MLQPLLPTPALALLRTWRPPEQRQPLLVPGPVPETQRQPWLNFFVNAVVEP